MSVPESMKRVVLEAQDTFHKGVAEAFTTLLKDGCPPSVARILLTKMWEVEEKSMASAIARAIAEGMLTEDGDPAVPVPGKVIPFPEPGSGTVH
jgi:hypothetical protein